MWLSDMEYEETRDCSVFKLNNLCPEFLFKMLLIFFAKQIGLAGNTPEVTVTDSAKAV